MSAPRSPLPLRLRMQAHLLQMNIAWEDKAANRRAVERLLDRATCAEGDLVVLPEMFDTGFSFAVERTADRDNATLDFLIRLAGDLGVYIVGGRTVQACDACLAHNRAVAVSPAGDLLAEYSKIHPFTYGREAERFEGGRDVVLFTWTSATERPLGGRINMSPRASAAASLRICPAVCYDLRFPELFRIGMLRGAELFTVIANWPASRQHHWRALLIARAIENQAFVLGVNRTGDDPNLSYTGGTIAVDPRGEILGELGPEEGVLSVEINPGVLASWREKFPAWRDARLISVGEA